MTDITSQAEALPHTELDIPDLGKVRVPGKVPFIVRFAELEKQAPVTASITSKSTDPTATMTGKSRDDTSG